MDPLIEWGVLVQLKVSNELYGAENPATLDLLFPSCSVHDESDVAPSLKGLKCDLLTNAPAVQFPERFACHPAFGNSEKRSNLVLIEFNSARGFAVNGQREVSTGFQVDGVENTDMGNGTGLMTSPGMETIGELR